MLTRLQVRDLAVDHGLSQWADSLASAAKVGWLLNVVAGAQPAPLSKIGGLPHLHQDEEWPLDDHGRPMTHLAQIAVSELPRPDLEWRDGIPTLLGQPDQVLRVFADLYDNPDGVGRALVLVRHENELLRHGAPALVAPEAEEEGRTLLRDLPVQLAPTVTVPELWPEIRDAVWEIDDGPAANLQRWYDALVPLERPQHVLCGHPRSLHDDVRYGASLNVEKLYDDVDDVTSPEEWTSFLHLHTAEPDGTLRGNELNILTPSSDLASALPHRLMCVPE